jgi:hypothetical protein
VTAGEVGGGTVVVAVPDGEVVGLGVWLGVGVADVVGVVEVTRGEGALVAVGWGRGALLAVEAGVGLASTGGGGGRTSR